MKPQYKRESDPNSSLLLSRLKRRETLYYLNAIIWGFVFAVIAIKVGNYLTSSLAIDTVSNPKAYTGIFILSLFMSIVAGDFFGRSLKTNEKSFYFVFTFFLVYLVILYINNAGIFYIPIILAVGIGALEMGDIINLKGPIGNIVGFMRKSSLSILGGTANYITIQPVANIYVGRLSWATWVIVLIFVVIVFVGIDNFKKKIVGHF